MAVATVSSSARETEWARELPSGRRLLITSTEGAETVEILSKNRSVEVTILLTDEGPVVRAAARRLEVDAAEDVSVDCRKFEVRADEVDLQTTGPIRLDGERIYLNCDQEAPTVDEDLNDE